MRTFSKSLLFNFSVILLLAAPDPPPDVDAALRARVQEFYQLQVDKKYRQAEQFVAADTKDYYYDSQKPDLRTFKIVEIKYAPDFNTATVTVTAPKQLLVPGAGPIELNIASPTEWKVEDGKWCWYVDRTKPVETPFGRVSPESGSKTDGAKSNPFADLSARVSADAVMNAVKADKTRVHLDPDNPKPQIATLKNTLPGPVTIQSLTNSPALKIEIAKPNLGPDETTQVTITPLPGSQPPTQLLLRVGPVGQTIKIDLDYSSPK